MLFILVEFSNQSLLILQPTHLWTVVLRSGAHFGPVSCYQGWWSHMVLSANTRLQGIPSRRDEAITETLRLLRRK